MSGSFDSSRVQDEVSEQVSSLVKEVKHLQQRLSQMEDRIHGLVPVRKLAQADNTLPGTYNGLRRWMQRRGIPLRTRTGKPKEEGSKARSFASMKEIRAEEADTTQAVSR